MQVIVNGEPKELPALCTVAQALMEVRAAQLPCAVEVNERLVQHAERGRAQLQEGDRVEIVTLVGGG